MPLPEAVRLAIADLAGLAGSLVLIAAYWATARHRLDSGSVPYLVVNVAGAALILFWIWQREQAPGILVWVTWAAIFLVLAVRLIRRT